MYNNSIHTVLTLLLFSYQVSGATNNVETMLFKYLFKQHNAIVRPVVNTSLPVNVSFGVELINLAKVDDRDQFVRSNIWVRQEWNNELLKWKPSEWNGTYFLQVAGEMVWKPDMVLYNNADDNYSGGTEKYKTKIKLYADGLHVWNSPATFTSTCSIDVRYFPFDRQQCEIKFGSWTYDKTGINLMLDPRGFITSNFVNSSSWQVVKTEKIRHVVYYKCCPDPYIDVTFKFTILRKPVYYVFNVILPCILLSITVLFGFFLPPDSGERISLTITVLLAIAVFLQMVSDSLPRNSDSIPVLSTFYMAVMIESALSLVTTCVVLIIHYRSSEKGALKMPEWVRNRFLRQIAPILGVSVVTNERESNYAQYQERKKFDVSLDSGFITSSFNRRENDGTFDSNIEKHRDSIEKMLSAKIKMRNTHMDGNDDTTLDGILNEIQMISAVKKLKNIKDEIEEEWRCLAKVLDRIFFWIYFVTIFLSSTCILVPAYLVYR